MSSLHLQRARILQSSKNAILLLARSDQLGIRIYARNINSALTKQLKISAIFTTDIKDFTLFLWFPTPTLNKLNNLERLGSNSDFRVITTFNCRDH